MKSSISYKNCLICGESFHLNGTELDYKSGLMFNNPNAKGACGCGTSFSA